MKYLLIPLFCLISLVTNAQKHFDSALKKQMDSVMVLDQKYRDTLTWLMTPNKVAATTKKLGMSAGNAINHYNKLQKI